MRVKVKKSKDEKIFKTVARRMHKKNRTPVNMRGGIRL